MLYRHIFDVFDAVMQRGDGIGVMGGAQVLNRYLSLVYGGQITERSHEPQPGDTHGSVPPARGTHLNSRRPRGDLVRLAMPKGVENYPDKRGYVLIRGVLIRWLEAYGEERGEGLTVDREALFCAGLACLVDGRMSLSLEDLQSTVNTTLTARSHTHPPPHL